MIKIIDGIAGGAELQLRRAPTLLRVVIDDEGNVDALDQLDDTPKPDELIIVYITKTHPSYCHIKSQKKELNGFWAIATYRVFEHQPDDEVLRDNKQWRAWAVAHAPSDLYRDER